jgi:hypothetical protein
VDDSQPIPAPAARSGFLAKGTAEKLHNRCNRNFFLVFKVEVNGTQLPGRINNHANKRHAHLPPDTHEPDFPDVHSAKKNGPQRRGYESEAC